MFKPTRVNFDSLHKATWPRRMRYSRPNLVSKFSLCRPADGFKVSECPRNKHTHLEIVGTWVTMSRCFCFQTQFYSTKKNDLGIELYYKRRLSLLLNYAGTHLPVLMRLIFISCKLGMWMDCRTEHSASLLPLPVITQDTPACVNIKRFALAWIWRMQSLKWNKALGD